MEYLVVSFNAVAPIFCMLALGYFLKWKGLFDDHTLSRVNNLCFKVFLPCLLFIDIYKTDMGKVLNLRLVVFAVAVVLVIYFTLVLLIPRIVTDPKRGGVMIQGIFRSNFVILGIPLSYAVFGSESTGVAAMLVGIVVPLYNLLSVITLQVFCSGKVSLSATVKQVLKNPLILSAALALVMLGLSIPLPVFVVNTLSDVGKIASPLSIVVLGGSFQFTKVAGNRKALIGGVTAKLVLVPAFVIITAILFGFQGIELMVLLTCTGTPTAISSFVMAEQMGGDSELAGELVVFTSLMSCGTLFLWIFLLQNLGFI